MPNKSRKRSKNHVPRRFLSDQEKNIIIECYKNGEDYKQIAEKINHKPRQVKDFINNYVYKIENNFTREDDMKILEILKIGIDSPSFIAKSIPGKSYYMVRNRIQFLTRRIFDIQTTDIEFFLNGLHVQPTLDLPTFDEYDPFMYEDL